MDREKIKKGLKDPVRAYKSIRNLARGHYYKIKYKLLNQDVIIGKNFHVRGRLIIKGPGKVVIGDNVTMDGSTTGPVTPFTNTKDAVIFFGNGVQTSSLRISCSKRVEIGDNSYVAESRILDTDFHSLDPSRRDDPDLIKSSPIIIGKNVWIGFDCVIMKGVTVEDNSTIAARSVLCSYTHVPEYTVFGGHPAVLMKKISRENE